MPDATHAGLLTRCPSRQAIRARSKISIGAPKTSARTCRLDVDALSHTVSPGYVASMGIPVVRGGETTRQAHLRPARHVVNETFVRRYLTGDPLDMRLDASLDEEGPGRQCLAHRWGGRRRAPSQRWGAAGAGGLRASHADEKRALPFTVSDVRTARDPRLPPANCEADPKREPNAVVDQVMTMDAPSPRVSPDRDYAVLLGGFASFALLIAGVGLFGGLSSGDSQRTR